MPTFIALTVLAALLLDKVPGWLLLSAVILFWTIL